MAECKRPTMIQWLLRYCCILCYVMGASPTTVEGKQVVRKSSKTTRTLVIGGFNARPGKFPYGQVSLFRQNDKHQCGGVIVAPDAILTAGHCKDVFDTVEIGAYNRTDPSQEAFIQTFQPVRKMLHPMFEASFYRFDVLVVQLDRPIDNVQPIRLNSNPRIPHQSSSLLTLIGWGSTNYATENQDRIFPSVLQQTWVPYVENDICERSEVNNKQLYKNEIFDEMLCAGRTGVDACRGDSGSPLILENSFYNGADILVGLVSWGRGCGKYPGVYTRISSVFPWIRSRLCRFSADPPEYLACQQEQESPALLASARPSASPFLSPPSPEMTGSTEEASESKNEPYSAGNNHEIDPPHTSFNETSTASVSTGSKFFACALCVVLSFTFLSLLWL